MLCDVAECTVCELRTTVAVNLQPSPIISVVVGNYAFDYKLSFGYCMLRNLFPVADFSWSSYSVTFSFPQYKKHNVGKLAIDLIAENIPVGSNGNAHLEANQTERHYQMVSLP